MNKHVQQVVNSVEVKQSEIIKNTVQRKNPIIQEKINQGTRSRASTSDKFAVASKCDTRPGSSRRCRVRSLDPTTIKQAKINQSVKHVEILEEQYIDKEIDVPVTLQRKVPTTQTVHREQWRSIRCSTSTQLTTFS